MRLRRWSIILVVVAGILSVSVLHVRGSRDQGIEPLQLFCGAGMMRPMEEILFAYGDEGGVAVQASYGGSGVLFGKLGAGQKCDVFLPGAADYVEEAVGKGWIVPGSRVDVVLHVPVIAVSTEAAAKVSCLTDLAQPGMRVGLGDPDACAIGRTADAILERSGLTESIRPNVRVRTATVNQLTLYLVMGQVDAAIIWEDLARLPEASGKLRAVSISPEENVADTISAARGVDCAQPERADDFIRFLISPRARDIWREWGFTPCGD
jgi:molybdate transport system substrate-binding protein